MYDTYQECFNIIRQYFNIQNVLSGTEKERSMWKKQLYTKIEEIEKIQVEDLEKKFGKIFMKQNKSDVLVCIESKNAIIKKIKEWK